MLIGQVDDSENAIPSLITAAPCAPLWLAAMIVWGPGYISNTHGHHSVPLVTAIEGHLLIRRDSGVNEYSDWNSPRRRPSRRNAARRVRRLASSIEFKSACPASAVVMRRVPATQHRPG